MRSLRSMCEKECGDHWSFSAKAIESLFAVLRCGGVICMVTGGRRYSGDLHYRKVNLSDQAHRPWA